MPVGTPGSAIVCRSVLDSTDPTCVALRSVRRRPVAGSGQLPERLRRHSGHHVGADRATSTSPACSANAGVRPRGLRMAWRSTSVSSTVVSRWSSIRTSRSRPATSPARALRRFRSTATSGLGSLRRSADPDRPEQLHRRADLRRRLPQVLVRAEQRPQVRHRYVQARRLEFAPIRDIRFRGSYNRAVRAPNIQELFAPQFVGLDGSNDPCAGTVITATDYGCLAQGLVVGQSPAANPAGQYNGLLGGNPNLNPEKGTTKTLGVVICSRSFIPRLALTVDWWNIKVEDAIQGFGADAILNACVNQIDGDLRFAGLRPDQPRSRPDRSG